MLVTHSSTEAQVSCSRSFFLSISSTSVFVIASALYTWLAFLGMEYQQKIQHFPDHVLEAEDDYIWVRWGWADDDYVFATSDEHWVSKFMIVYFAASFGFVITGVLDYLSFQGIMSVILILAGVFGVISSLFIEADEYLANVFNAVSVHLFLAEAVALFYQHFRGEPSRTSSMRAIVLFGDFCFILGSFTDVVLSYFSVFNMYEMRHGRVEIMAAFAWLVCSLVYVGSVLHEERVLRKALAEKIAAMEKSTNTDDDDPAKESEGNDTEPSV